MGRNTRGSRNVKRWMPRWQQAMMRWWVTVFIQVSRPGRCTASERAKKCRCCTCSWAAGFSKWSSVHFPEFLVPCSPKAEEGAVGHTVPPAAPGGSGLVLHVQTFLHLILSCIVRQCSAHRCNIRIFFWFKRHLFTSVGGIFCAFGCFRLKIPGQWKDGAEFPQLAPVKSSPSVSFTHFRKHVALFQWQCNKKFAFVEFVALL